MANSTEQHLALINHLLSEKDRLIAEKDELVVSQDKLWQALYEIVRHKDEELECAREERARLVEQNTELKEALREFLNREDDSEADEDEEDEDDGKLEIPPHPNIDYEKLEDHPMTDDGGSGRRFECSLPTPQASDHLCSSIEAAVKDVPVKALSKRSKKAESPSTFTFAPGITLAEDGAYDFGKIDKVAQAVIDSIHAQIALLSARCDAGRTARAPSKHFKSTKCLWNWMHNMNRRDVYWTINEPGRYAWGSCFNGGGRVLHGLGM